MYDIIERIWKHLKTSVGGSSAAAFEQAINDFFVEKGIGWQLVKGEIITRGTEAFEATVKMAQETSRNPADQQAAKQ